MRPRGLAFKRVVLLFTGLLLSANISNGKPKMANAPQKPVFESPKGQNMVGMKITQPEITEEDKWSPKIAEHYLCEACRAIVYQLNSTFNEWHIARPGKKMSVWEVVDLTEQTCEDNFEDYGIKRVNGQNRLAGPGLTYVEDEKEDKKAYSMFLGQEGWEKRLKTECLSVVNDKIGDEEIYDFWKQGKFNDWDLICEPHGYCGDLDKKREDKAKRRMDEKKDKSKVKEKKEPKNKNIALHTFMEKAAADYSTLTDSTSEHFYPPAAATNEITKPRPYHEWVYLFEHFALFWDEQKRVHRVNEDKEVYDKAREYAMKYGKKEGEETVAEL